MRHVPQVHWIVLLLLGSSVLVTFLFESDQAVLLILSLRFHMLTAPPVSYSRYGCWRRPPSSKSSV